MCLQDIMSKRLESQSFDTCRQTLYQSFWQRSYTVRNQISLRNLRCCTRDVSKLVWNQCQSDDHCDAHISIIISYPLVIQTKVTPGLISTRKIRSWASKTILTSANTSQHLFTNLHKNSWFLHQPLCITDARILISSYFADNQPSNGTPTSKQSIVWLCTGPAWEERNWMTQIRMVKCHLVKYSPNHSAKYWTGWSISIYIHNLR